MKTIQCKRRKKKLQHWKRLRVKADVERRLRLIYRRRRQGSFLSFSLSLSVCFLRYTGKKRGARASTPDTRARSFVRSVVVGDTSEPRARARASKRESERARESG